MNWADLSQQGNAANQRTTKLSWQMQKQKTQTNDDTGLYKIIKSVLLPIEGRKSAWMQTVQNMKKRIKKEHHIDT